MINNKKIIFFDPHIDKPRGHHLDSLIAKSLSLKNSGTIYWIVNKNFKRHQENIPKHIKILNISDTAKRKIFLLNILQNLKTLFLILKNFFLTFIIIFSLIKKKNFTWLIPFFFNFCSFPKYLPSIFDILNKLNLGNSDHFIFNSCSDINDYELAYFLTFLNKENFSLHLFIRSLPKFHKKNIKNPIYFLKRIPAKNIQKKFFLYAETQKNKNLFFKNYKMRIDLFHDFYTFFQRPKKLKKINVGFFGEARINKGFKNYLKLIKKTFEYNPKINYFVQFSRVPEEILFEKKQIIKYSKKNKNVKIIPNYLNYFQYRKFLTKINIAPILYERNLLNEVGSGIVFSCIANEIPMVIPKNSPIKKMFKYNCYLEADSISEYAKKILEISKNYNYFLSQSKKQSEFFQKKINDYPFLKRVEKNFEI